MLEQSCELNLMIRDRVAIVSFLKHKAKQSKDSWHQKYAKQENILK